MDFLHVKAGDEVLRDLCGVKMRLKVDRVDDFLIHTKGGWTFDRKTGIEEDSDLGWGIAFNYTGSVLVAVYKDVS